LLCAKKTKTKTKQQQQQKKKNNNNNNNNALSEKYLVHFVTLVLHCLFQDEDTEALLAADFEIGHFIRERVVPRAVLYFTGEALENDDVCIRCFCFHLVK
jgi:hypothetical protein